MPDSPQPPSYDELAALVQRQAEQITALIAEVAELRRRLGTDSSKPPSADGLRKTKRLSSGSSGKKEVG